MACEADLSEAEQQREPLTAKEAPGARKGFTLRRAVLTMAGVSLLGAAVRALYSQRSTVPASAGSASPDTADLIQRDASPAGVGAAAGGHPGGPQRTLAMEGGGWKAQTVHAGLLTGLLAAHRRKHGTSGAATFEGSGLLEGFSALSSNSGGTWFTSSLVFSESFMLMLEAMGAEPFKAGRIYNQDYTKKLLSIRDALDSGPSNLNKTRQDCRRLFDKIRKVASIAHINASSVVSSAVDAAVSANVPVGQVLELLSLLAYDGQVGWPTLVKHILQSTANISSSASLGSAVNAFAKGKMWLVSASLVTPGGDVAWAPAPDDSAFLSRPSLVNPTKYISYQASSSSVGPDFPYFVPAKYSVVLGAGAASPAPLPFCAGESCFSLRYDYTARNLGRPQHASSAPLGEAYGPALAAAAGRLPLYQVASSSSSAFGSVVLGSKLSAAYGSCLDFTTWVSSSPGGDAFSTAQDAIMPNVAEAYTNSKVFQELAAATTAPIVDGGFTDNTGIAHAVAAGATEVVVFLQWYDLINLFAPSNKAWGDDFVFSQVHFQVFAESAEDVLTQFQGRSATTGAGFEYLEVPPGNSTFLANLSFGTIRATTVECPWFGVRPGIPVTLHALWPNILLGIGGTDSWYDYGTALNEITSTMMYEPNRALTESMLALVQG